MNEKRNWCVYVHISPSSKYYIGITSQTPEQRWRHGNGYKKSIAFYNAIKKYGWDNIQHEIIAERLTENEAKNFEILLIDKLKSNQKQYGYNITSGGDGAKGVSHYGKDNPFFGRKHSIETKEILRQSAIKQWEKGILNESICRPIYQFDLSGNFVAKYSSIRDAERETGIDHSVISRVCRNKLNYTHGFTWVYQDECEDFSAFKQKFLEKLERKTNIAGRHKRKPVNLYDLAGFFIAQFESASDLAQKLNVHKDTVSCACRHNSILQNRYRCKYA